MQAYCTNCGSVSLDHANYCWNRGRSLSGEQSLSVAWRTEYKEVYLDWSDQGNRVLIGEDLEEVSLIPAGLEAFGFDAHLGGGLPAQEIEGQVAEHREV